MNTGHNNAYIPCRLITGTAHTRTVRHNQKKMKKAISILILILVSKTVWCSQIAVGVDRSKVVILEYWKFEDGEGDNEMMIFNPTNEGINVVFRKWYRRKKDEPERVYTESDILLRTKKIKPNRYLQFEDAAAEIREIYKGLIEVIVNGKKVGLYDLARKEKKPRAIIERGIVFNQRSNTGGYLQYEIIYDGLKFQKNKSRRVKVAYLEKEFYSSGFVKGEKYNPHNIGIENITVDNLKIGERENFDLDLVATGELGTFEVTFTNLLFRKRIVQRNFNHMITKGRGQTIAFNVLNGVCFDRKRRYKKRK